MPAGQNDEYNDMNEILLTIKEFADNVYQRFDEIDKKFVEVDKRFLSLENRFDTLESEVGHIKVNMVTKDYLDDKLANFSLFNHKLINVLENKKVINRLEVQELSQLT